MSHGYGSHDAFAQQMEAIRKSITKNWTDPATKFHLANTAANSINYTGLRAPALENMQRLQDHFLQSTKNPFHDQLKSMSQSNALLQYRAQSQVAMPNAFRDFIIPIDTSKIIGITYAPTSPAAHFSQRFNTDLQTRMRAMIDESGRIATVEDVEDIVQEVGELVTEEDAQEFADTVVAPSALSIADDLMRRPADEIDEQFEQITSQFDAETTSPLDTVISRSALADQVVRTSWYAEFRARHNGVAENALVKHLCRWIVGLALTVIIVCLPPEATEFAILYMTSVALVYTVVPKK